MSASGDDVDDGLRAQRRGRQAAIVAQCFGSLPKLLFSYGIILLYLKVLNISGSGVLLFLSLFNLLAVLQVIPAWLADRYGLKRIGNIGHILGIMGFAALTVAGGLHGSRQLFCIYLGIVLFSIGDAFFTSSWFSLLSGVVPEAIRGRFFGRLRFTWQTFGLVFVGICALGLRGHAPVWKYQIIMGLVTLALGLRFFVYAKIPERVPAKSQRCSLMLAFGAVIQAVEYRTFSAYVFLLSLMTMSAPVLFGLAEKEALGMDDRTITLLGGAIMGGALAGFAAGGFWIDRHGTKLVFMACHLGYGMAILLFVLRGWASSWMVMYLAGVNALFGFVSACSSIAITTETLYILPKENRSIAASFCYSLVRVGGAISGITSAWLIDIGALSESWRVVGMTFSQYDTLLVLCAFSVFLLVVTLGLVPSVFRKSQWAPDGRHL